MHTHNPAYRRASVLKWGIVECRRLNGVVLRKRRHNPLRTMLYLRDVVHANRAWARLEAHMMKPPGTLRKRWKCWRGSKTMELRHASRGIPTD